MGEISRIVFLRRVQRAAAGVVWLNANYSRAGGYRLSLSSEIDQQPMTLREDMIDFLILSQRAGP